MRISYWNWLILVVVVVRDAGAFNSQLRTHRAAGKCDYVKLVDCFVGAIGNYARKLWDNRINVVRVSADECKHVKKLGSCVNDAKTNFGCSWHDVRNTSTDLTQLLVHRNTRSTFIKSYYLLKYACSDEGQQILGQDNVRQCLENDKIGESTLAASSYLANQYLDKPAALSRAGRAAEGKNCEIMQTRIKQYNKALTEICEGNAVKVMCNSLKAMILGMYKDKVGGTCDIDCEKHTEMLAAAKASNHNGAEKVVKEVVDAVQNPNAAAGTRTVFASVNVLLAILLARWL